MSLGTSLLSIHDATPTDFGGVNARIGFLYQDHIAASYLLAMAQDPELAEVWCESFDDLTLLWHQPPNQVLEFVQVKSSDLGKFWSVADLCRQQKETSKSSKTNVASNGSRQSGKPKASLFEQSLAHDNYSEDCRFRVITQLPVVKDLDLLKLPLDHPERRVDSQRFKTLLSKMELYVGTVRSPRGRGLEFWTTQAVWDVRESVEAVENKSKLFLQELANGMGQVLLGSSLNEVYSQILAHAKNAADAKWQPDPAKKKISRQSFINWLSELIQTVLSFSPAGTSDVLKRKMTEAALPSDMQESAISLRRKYLGVVRMPPAYLDLSDREDVEGEIEFGLQRLRARMYSGELPNDGTIFLNECLSELERIRSSRNSSSSPPAYFYAGCMYEMTNRCAHRFNRRPE